MDVTHLLVLPYSSLSDKAFPAQFTVMALYAKVLVLGLFVLVQVVLVGRPVVTLVTDVGFLAGVCVDMLSEFVLSAKLSA
jgi:hypothetical protein